MVKVVCFDLDDTLHKEINYLKAAYRLIAKEIFPEQWEEYYHKMLDWYYDGENVFQKIVDIKSGEVELAGLIQMYRYNVHKLMLPIEVDEVLQTLKAKGIKLGLITDGRELTQSNKIKALGLNRYFSEDMVIISEVFGSEKPSMRNYEYFMKKFPEASFAYVGDNPKKDFIAPNLLGWDTVCLLDDGRNIHMQDFTLEEKYLPKLKINKIKELISLI
ncbi:HAD family hydrolase [Parabacteroides distasonis]|jgi:HAD hydrolase, family IA, variant 1|uniref:HAD family hydrolase n=1 Tax=Parabacteroides distasonis TaxID=823 RepID=UPI00189E7977|nr:HAD family hydrolase [Parabacteroides distasonis]MDB9150926.1 HAD family hydrolase [Parabacteroides distasonis]MDB9155436.1 HAD family hydrolase [Parabacteroides distasonis]MDB9163766.1 HAD family hydrolase [Parabacteroides distasonis]MDB9167990.1 HAD family hydrolase [Parabacteroides distasonis]MDB9193762.1 HAD family hydrolase [Parabacteroides distasonis]